MLFVPVSPVRRLELFPVPVVRGPLAGTPPGRMAVGMVLVEVGKVLVKGVKSGLGRMSRRFSLWLQAVLSFFCVSILMLQQSL